MRRFPLPITVLAALTTLLVSCSNDPNVPPFKSQRDDGSPWLVRYGATSEDPRSLDPQVTYDQVSRRILEPVQECLLEYHPFKTDPYELQPCLLESLPKRESGPDGKIAYRCVLKKGVRFHSDPCFKSDGPGRAILAADVRYAFQRIADPAVESPALATLADYLTGLQAASDAAKKAGFFDYNAPFPPVELVNDHEFVLHLDRAYPQILYWLAMHFTSPVAREAVEYYDGKNHDDGPHDLFRFHPVGSGPFKIGEWVRGKRIRLVRNPDYQTTRFPSEGWESSRENELRPLANKQLPLVDEVHMTIFREVIPIFLLFRQGYLDGMGVGKDAFSSLMTPSRELSPKYQERGVTLHRDVDPSTYYMHFNLEDSTLGKNKKLRQALSSAFDKESYVSIFFNNVPVPAEQLLPPGIPGHQKDFKNPYGYNLERAKKLIAEAGYPNGRDASGKQLEISIETTANSADERTWAEFEQRQFEELGIKVKINENTFARMMEKLDQGSFQIASGSGWGADYPDPENFFFLYYSKNTPPAGKNAGRYNNPEFDRLFEQVAVMENSPERIALCHKLNDILSEDAPHILIQHKSLFALTQPWAPRTQSNPMLEGGLKYSVLLNGPREELRKAWNRPSYAVPITIVTLAGALALALGIIRPKH